MPSIPSAQPPVIEGEAPLDYPSAGKPLKTWYRVTGELSPSSIPLFILHGGPGVGAEAYNILSDCKRKPVRVTSSGTRTSSSPNFTTSFATLASTPKDVSTMSWATPGEACLARRSRLQSLEKLVLRQTLPKEVREVMDKCEADGTTESEEYQGAMMQYYARFLCRLNPVPEEIMDGLAELRKDPTVYLRRWGPSEWHVTGTLANWSVLDRVSTIEVPVLLLNGKYDEAQDSCIKAFLHRLPRAKWVKFTGESTSHMSHFEEKERFMQVVGEFLTDNPAI